MSQKSVLLIHLVMGGAVGGEGVLWEYMLRRKRNDGAPTPRHEINNNTF